MAKQPPRKFSLKQVRRRLKGLALELAAIGAAYHLEKGELRRRCLILRDAVRETIDRFPNSQ